MFVGMTKNFWALWVSFLQIKKSQATKLHQIPLFHTITNSSTLMGAKQWVRALLLLRPYGTCIFYNHRTTQ